MFYNLNSEYYPLIIFKFNNIKINNISFEKFMKDWINLYKKNKNFILIFDTTFMSIPNIKYCFKMAAFIKKIRKFNPQYLNRSIIIVKNKKISNLLELIFFLQSPVAPVYITNDNLHTVLNKIKIENNLNSLNELNNCNISISKVNIIKKIKSKKPLFPFL